MDFFLAEALLWFMDWYIGQKQLFFLYFFKAYDKYAAFLFRH